VTSFVVGTVWLALLLVLDHGDRPPEQLPVVARVVAIDPAVPGEGCEKVRVLVELLDVPGGGSALEDTAEGRRLLEETRGDPRLLTDPQPRLATGREAFGLLPATVCAGDESLGGVAVGDVRVVWQVSGVSEVALRPDPRPLVEPELLAAGYLGGPALFVVYQLFVAPLRGHSECWFRFVRSVRLLRPGARARWRAAYGRQPHLNGWDLWGLPYPLHLDDDVERERLDRKQVWEKRLVGRVWVDGRPLWVGDLAGWLEGEDLPRRVELRTSRLLMTWHLLLSAVLIALGVHMVKEDHWAGWPSVVIFGLCASVSALLLVRPDRLELTREGLRSTQALRRPTVLPWAACWDFVPRTTLLGERRGATYGVGVVTDRRREFVLPSTYGHGGSELCAFLRLYRDRSLGTPTIPHDPDARVPLPGVGRP
jgi:hypothetical protein